MEPTVLHISINGTKHSNAVRQKVGRVIEFPDGITRMVRLQSTDWEMFDILVDDGYSDCITSGAVKMATRWQGRDGVSYETYLLRAFRDKIRAHRDLRHEKYCGNDND